MLCSRKNIQRKQAMEKPFEIMQFRETSNELPIFEEKMRTIKQKCYWCGLAISE